MGAGGCIYCQHWFHFQGNTIHFAHLQKKLVLPNMEDLVIPLLNSGLPEVDDKLSALASPSATK